MILGHGGHSCDYVGCGLDDLPERAVGAFVRLVVGPGDAAPVLALRLRDGDSIRM
jgi:hypothetical protein